MDRIRKPGLLLVLALTLLGNSGCDTLSQIGLSITYTNPGWAPPYAQGVRYYYMPDIETYYDLSDQQFCYLQNGQWAFSPSLPPMYSNYDLYTGFVISLNVNVYQPWLHHQYYVSHYPRYYYRNVYPDFGRGQIRGFSEYDRKPIYWRPEDRNRINDLRRNDMNQPRNEIRRDPQPTQYYGRNIGRPVRVTPRMKKK